MTVEAATYVSELNPALPSGSNAILEGDNHLRLLKSVLQNTFPGLGGRAWRTQSKAANYTILPADNMTLIACTTAITLSFSAVATLGNGFFCTVLATSGSVILDPNGSETIDGVATVTVEDDTMVDVFCTGGGLFTSLNRSMVLDGGVY